MTQAPEAPRPGRVWVAVPLVVAALACWSVGLVATDSAVLIVVAFALAVVALIVLVRALRPPNL